MASGGMDSGFGRLPVTQLNRGNYATWRVQMKMYLISQDLWSYVDGSATVPNSTEVNEHRKYVIKRDKCLASIVLSVESNHLYLLGDPTDPVKVWKLLQDTFMKNSIANKLRIKKRLYSMKLSDSGSMGDHIKSFVELYDELAVVGGTIEEEDKVLNLLASLPDRYSTLVTALEAQDSIQSFECVKTKLLHEYEKFKGKEEESALIIRKKEFKPKCFHCGKTGHIKRNCWSLQKQQGDNEKKTAAIAGGSAGNNETMLTAVTSSGTYALSHETELARNRWIVDTGATQHMCCDITIFSSVKTLPVPIEIQVGNGETTTATSSGDVKLNLKLPNNVTTKCTVKNVLFVPGLVFNLLSVSQLTQNGKKTNFNNSFCKIIDDNDTLLAVATKVGNLYYLNCVMSQSGAAFTTQALPDANLWHRRFGHLGKNGIELLCKKRLVNGFHCGNENIDGVCENCCDGKIHRCSFPKNKTRRPRKPFELIHSDICGKINPQSFGGKSYFIIFIDECTHYVWCYSISAKSEAFQRFRDWKNLVENQFSVRMKILRTDNGGEYTSNEFKNYLKDQGIRHETTIPKTPEQNGVAERMNRTLVETVRSMISDAKVPKSYWAEALNTAVYLRNRSPTSTLKNATPYEILYGTKPNVSHLKVFGSIAYAHIPKDERQKLDSKSRKCIFLGYGETTKGYRLLDTNTQKIIYSCNVIFDENKRCTVEKE